MFSPLEFKTRYLETLERVYPLVYAIITQTAPILKEWTLNFDSNNLGALEYILKAFINERGYYVETALVSQYDIEAEACLICTPDDTCFVSHLLFGDSLIRYPFDGMLLVFYEMETELKSQEGELLLPIHEESPLAPYIFRGEYVIITNPLLLADYYKHYSFDLPPHLFTKQKEYVFSGIDWPPEFKAERVQDESEPPKPSDS